jgi:pimeloyl-ACP methyl ester carboxylesterase
MDVDWREHLRQLDGRLRGRGARDRYGAQVQRLCLASPAGLSMEHMRNERNRGLRARIENVLFFGTYRAASKSDGVVRRERLRRALLLLLAAHPERLPSALAGLIPGARKIVYEDTGHLVMLERPDRFNADLRAFLEEEEPGARHPWPGLRTLAK